jgi:hypothetical protein
MELKKLNKVIVLFLYGFFFLFNISWFLNRQIVNLIDLVRGTFFESLITLLNILSTVFGSIIFTISLIFFAGSLVLLLLTFIFDVLLSETKN